MTDRCKNPRCNHVVLKAGIYCGYCDALGVPELIASAEAAEAVVAALRAEVERLKAQLAALAEQYANMGKEAARLSKTNWESEAELERLKADEMNN